jgi:hypothetical protein
MITVCWDVNDDEGGPGEGRKTNCEARAGGLATRAGRRVSILSSLRGSPRLGVFDYQKGIGLAFAGQVFQSSGYVKGNALVLCAYWCAFTPIAKGLKYCKCSEIERTIRREL